MGNMVAYTIRDSTSTVLPVFVLALCAVFTSRVETSLLDPIFLGQELRAFANDALGVDELQEYFNRLAYDRQTIDGTTVTQELALKLKDKFKTRFDVARRLKHAVEASYDKAPRHTTAQQCCEVDKSALVYDERFRQSVDTNNICVKISEDSPPNPVHLDSEEILKEIKAISKEYPFIKWQYFASQEGVFTNFPVYNDTEPCERYDPRIRPYYVETATPEAKDVVLVIDTSASMVAGKINIAKEAAKMVLETMNPKDQIGVVSFNDEASTYMGSGVNPCYSERLALAVPTNKNALKAYIESLTGRGNSIYKVAFEKACALLKATAPGKSEKRVILFLTDGDPSDTNRSLIFKTIRDCNSELNNSVIIFTFGIGTVNQELLTDIATQKTEKYGYPSDGIVTEGNYTHIEDIDMLQIKMATYYNYLPPASSGQPIVSVPYVDLFGTGLLISMTLPCYDNQGKFIGVAGTDINIEELFSDITFLNQDQKTYAFIISSSGRTLVHPLLPVPNHAYADPTFLDIRTLEPDSEFDEVFNSMTRASSGTKTFPATRYLLRGGDMLDGVTVKRLNSTYYWSPVTDTEFSIALVMPVAYEWEVLNPLQIPPGYSFNYHRIDLTSPRNACLHFRNVVTKDTTVVKFAPGAFLDSYEYIGLKETNISVEILDNYMMGKLGREYSKLKTGVRDTVIATWKVEKLWFGDRTDLAQYLVWRYIGTANGVFRKTPGSALPKTYDPRNRTWYRAALSHSGLIILTTPYLDIAGAGEVLTIARSVFRQESSDNVLGVVGADFTLRHFYRLLTKVYPICADTSKYACFVMDNAGFLVLHVDFMLSSTTARHLEHVHITQKEKHITEDLIRKNFLVKKECRNIEKIQRQTFYEVNLPPGGVEELGESSQCKYQLTPISGTNVFLGVAVRHPAFCDAKDCSCSLDKKCSTFNLSCECPCTSSLAFDHCRSLFPKSSIPICPTVAPAGEPDDSERRHTGCLEKCFNPQCPKRNSSKLCDGVIDCYWCQKDKYNLPLDKPYCASSDRCFRGKESAAKQTDVDGAECSANTHDTEEARRGGNSLSTGSIAAIAVGCPAFLFLVIILVFLGVKRSHNTAAPPVKDKGSTVSTQNETLNMTPSGLVPDVLIRSIHNSGFVTYDEIDELRLPEHGRGAQNQWPPPYNERQSTGTNEQPAYPGKASVPRDIAPPIPRTRRPSTFETPRPRSQTEPCPMQEIPMTRMHSGIPLSQSFSQAGINSIDLPNTQQPVGVPRKLSVVSQTDSPSRRTSVEDQPPPLIPRVRRLSEGNRLNVGSDISPGEGTHVYSNATAIPEVEETPNSGTHDNDDTDSHGLYVEVINASSISY